MTDLSQPSQWIPLVLQLVQSLSLIATLAFFAIHIRQSIRTRRNELFVTYEVLEDALVFTNIFAVGPDSAERLDEFEFEVGAYLRERKHSEAKKSIL